MTSLIVTTADYQTGKTQQTTFTGVNPAATAAELQTFGEMTAALSKDTFVKATRVEQTNCAVTKQHHLLSTTSSIRKGATSAPYQTFTLNQETGIYEATCTTEYFVSGFAALWFSCSNDFKIPPFTTPYLVSDTANVNNYFSWLDGSFQWRLTLKNQGAQILLVSVVCPETDDLYQDTFSFKITITEV
ncbi:MAG: hypothetical protein IKI76_03125 [Selenomonadaceae bacterium]|nr:hypothetical protein [Selenomonadaceae bacterium]